MVLDRGRTPEGAASGEPPATGHALRLMNYRGHGCPYRRPHAPWQLENRHWKGHWAPLSCLQALPCLTKSQGPGEVRSPKSEVRSAKSGDRASGWVRVCTFPGSSRAARAAWSAQRADPTHLGCACPDGQLREAHAPHCKRRRRLKQRLAGPTIPLTPASDRNWRPSPGACDKPRLPRGRDARSARASAECVPGTPRRVRRRCG